MKKQLLLLVMMLLPIVANADAVEIDGIWYNLISKAKIAEVTYMPSGKYSGDIQIPEVITYGDSEFRVTVIGASAFSYCTSLTSITIPNSVTSIESAAFYNCTSLTTILIPNSVNTIGESAFWMCSDLTSVIIGNNVKKIDYLAFRGCNRLSSINIPSSVTNIGNRSFEGCTKLNSVHITDLAAWCNINFDGEYANPLNLAHHLYLNGNELVDLIIPEGISAISAYAFEGCFSIASITIPNSVTNIGDVAFSGCTSLTSITIPNSMTSIGHQTFSGCTNLSSITIPNGITSIGESAFSNCTSLTSITIPNSVTSMGIGAFYGCTNLTKVIIGSCIKLIDFHAFANCQELTDVTCLAENLPNTRSDVFNGSFIEYATLHVPAISVNAYKASEPWSSFKEVVALTDQELSISGITSNSKTEGACYTIGGQRIIRQTNGLNIVRMSDGTTIKVIVK